MRIYKKAKYPKPWGAVANYFQFCNSEMLIYYIYTCVSVYIHPTINTTVWVCGSYIWSIAINEFMYE